jgi:hypothetical protein
LLPGLQFAYEAASKGECAVGGTGEVTAQVNGAVVLGLLGTVLWLAQ